MGNAVLKHQASITLSPITLFKALSDSTRLACLLLVAAEERVCVCEFEHALGEDQPKISRHLALLRKDHIVDTERRGKWVYYHLSAQLPEWAKQVVTLALAEDTVLVENLRKNLLDMPDRPSCC